MGITEVSLQNISSSNLENYLINEDQSKAIEVPLEVLNIIKNKLRTPNDIDLLALSDIIAMGIDYSIKTGNTEGFRKTLQTLGDSSAFGNDFTRADATALYKFFSQVPKGYYFNQSNSIMSHAEMSLKTLN